MTQKLDPSTRNNDIGLYWNKSRKVDPSGAGLPYRIPDFATGISVSTAGTVVWVNWAGESQITSFEAGEWKPLAAKEILLGDTIDGVAETTTATGLYWTTSPANLLENK
jgi:hypothetical protein